MGACAPVRVTLRIIYFLTWVVSVWTRPPACIHITSICSYRFNPFRPNTLIIVLFICKVINSFYTKNTCFNFIYYGMISLSYSLRYVAHNYLLPLIIKLIKIKLYVYRNTGTGNLSLTRMEPRHLTHLSLVL